MLDNIPAAANARHSLSLDINMRAKPEGQSETIDLLCNPLLHLGRGGHSRGNDLAGKCLFTDIHGKRINSAVTGKFLLRSGFDPSGCQRISTTQLFPIRFFQRFIKLIIQLFG